MAHSAQRCNGSADAVRRAAPRSQPSAACRRRRAGRGCRPAHQDGFEVGSRTAWRGNRPSPPPGSVTIGIHAVGVTAMIGNGGRCLRAGGWSSPPSAVHLRHLAIHQMASYGMRLAVRRFVPLVTTSVWYPTCRASQRDLLVHEVSSGAAPPARARLAAAASRGRPHVPHRSARQHARGGHRPARTDERVC